MINFETQMVVHETKGLLKGLERQISTTEFQLATDNLELLNDKLNDMRQVLDRIEKKVNDYRATNEKEEGDDLL